MHVIRRKQTEVYENIDRQNQVQVYLKILEASCMLFKYEASSKQVESPKQCNLVQIKPN